MDSVNQSVLESSLINPTKQIRYYCALSERVPNASSIDSFLKTWNRGILNNLKIINLVGVSQLLQHRV